MSDKPIIFSGPMVRAILEGRPYLKGSNGPTQIMKTQTRRVMKPQPIVVSGCQDWWFWKDRQWPVAKSREVPQSVIDSAPYHVGDRLWVREAWGIGIRIASASGVIYRADFLDKKAPLAEGEKWRSPIHIPRRASRITLLVTRVWAQRIQDICVTDCVNEGADFGIAWTVDTKPNFIKLWDEINAKCGLGWDKNPWVWAIEFKRVEAKQ
jgi:hypothetical protein